MKEVFTISKILLSLVIQLGNGILLAFGPFNGNMHDR